MKKFLSLLTALTLLVSMMTAFTTSAAVNTTTFYNADTDNQIISLDGVNSVYATTTFTGRYENNASVIAAHYDADGKLTKTEFINPVTSTIGESVEYTTPHISVTDTDILKIFAWTGVDTIKPLLKFPGVISRSIPLPTATVTELDVATITTVPLTFAMNFKADPATEAQLLAYGNWYADFELKINKDVTFNLDGTKDGYLAGQYDSWSPAWVTVPKKDVTLAANTPLKIMETGAETYGEPGLKYTYQEVYDRVKDFDCGVFFTDEFLAANPDLYVTLELKMYNPLDESESYVIGKTYEFGTKAFAVYEGNMTDYVSASALYTNHSGSVGLWDKDTEADSQVTYKLLVEEDGVYTIDAKLEHSTGYQTTFGTVYYSINGQTLTYNGGFTLGEWTPSAETIELTADIYDVTITYDCQYAGNAIFISGLRTSAYVEPEATPTPEPTEEPEPTPTPTPDVPVGEAPSELNGADFVAAMTNTTNMVANGDYAEFGYTQSASFTVTLGVEAEGDYQLAALFGSNESYVFNSEVTKVFVDGVEVTSFPQSCKINPNWTGASDVLHLTEGPHEFTLSTKSSWNRLYIYGLRLENVTTTATVLTAQNVVAEVPAGVALESGATTLSLSLTDLEESQSGIEANENQTLDSMDIHIDGVSSANTTPILVTVTEAAPTGLNKGNLELYHVDNGETISMVEVESKEDLVAANQFTYDPADGTVTLAMTSFSEIAMLSDNTKVWNGEYDTSWYNTTATYFEIANADQMAGLGAIVGGMAEGIAQDDFTGKTIKLISDLNFGGEANIYYPVGYYNNLKSYEKVSGGSVTSNVSSFEGAFDGNGNTIANIYQNTWSMFGDYNDGYEGTPNHYKDAMGIFGYVKGTVKNLNVENFTSDGEFTPTGVVAAYAGGNAIFENITLKNCNPRVYNTGNGGIVGINGRSDEVCNLTFKNITID